MNVCTSFSALAYAAPFPTMTRGFWADFKIAQALEMSVGSGRARGGGSGTTGPMRKSFSGRVARRRSPVYTFNDENRS